MSQKIANAGESMVSPSSPEAGTVATARRPHEAEAPVLAHMLEMADRYQAENALQQATEMYFELVECHGNTREARRARARLMKIADGYERDGKLHMARSIYERLL